MERIRGHFCMVASNGAAVVGVISIDRARGENQRAGARSNIETSAESVERDVIFTHKTRQRERARVRVGCVNSSAGIGRHARVLSEIIGNRYIREIDGRGSTQ